MPSHLPASHVERKNAGCATLQQAVDESSRRAAQIDAVSPAHQDRKILQRARQLLPATTGKAARCAHFKRGGSGDQRAWLFNFLGINKDAPRENQDVGFLTIFSKSALNK